MSRSSRPSSSTTPSVAAGGINNNNNNRTKQVDFLATVAPAPGTQSATEQKIVSSVKRLQDLVNQESKWRNRIITSVQTCGNIDLSSEKMDEYINQCYNRIKNLREEASKLADKQMHLVSFEPNVYKQWFEGLGSDPLSINPAPTVVASCNQALSGSPAGERGGGSKSSSVRKNKNSNNNANQQAPQQYLDGIALPEKFWKRRQQQKQALSNVYLTIFDLPRLNRERSHHHHHHHNSKTAPSTSAEMVYQLQEATRLSSSGPAQLKELLHEYRMREKDVQAGLFNAMINSNTAELNQGGAGNSGSGAGGKNDAAKRKMGASMAAGGLSGGNTSARGRPSSGAHRGGKGSHHGNVNDDINGEPVTMKMCLQTGVFIHDPQSDDLALSTDLRTGDFFDIGSPRCLDQRILHRVMTLRSRRLRLEECISVFEEEKRQLQRRRDLQKEMTGLGQYSLFATKPEIEKTVAEEKRLQKQKLEEIEAQKLAEKHGLLRKGGKHHHHGSGGASSLNSTVNNNHDGEVGGEVSADKNANSTLSLDESAFMGGGGDNNNAAGISASASPSAGNSHRRTSGSSPQQGSRRR